VALQVLTLTLDGITAGDYIAWVRDPEPSALGVDLRSIAVRGGPVGDIVEAAVAWDGSPPAPTAAAAIADLPLIPEVTAVGSRVLAAVGSRVLAAAA
jgi:hypothetical protein